jgi:ribonucleoside-diphosphate reductase subunit M2
MTAVLHNFVDTTNSANGSEISRNWRSSSDIASGLSRLKSDESRFQSFNNGSKRDHLAIEDLHRNIDWKEYFEAEKHEPLLTGMHMEKHLTEYGNHRYKDVYDMYNKMQASLWVVEEIDLETDVREWETKLNENEKKFLTNIFAFFKFGDSVVIENCAFRFLRSFQDFDIRATYISQLQIEVVHGYTYAAILERFLSPSDIEKLHKEIVDKSKDNKFRRIYKRAKHYMTKSQPLLVNLVAFACFEGVVFSGAFCSIFWLKKRGLMPGLCFSNELISRDEGMHADYACLLYALFEKKLSVKHITMIIKDMTEEGVNLICNCIPCNLLGINSILMKEYIEFTANRLFLAFGYEVKDVPYPGVKNPFEWMELISLQGKTNFFEKRVSEYSMAAKTNMINASLNGGEEERDVFTTDADF